MFLGSSSFIPVNKAPKKEPPKSAVGAARLMFLDSAISGTSFEVALFPSPCAPLEGDLYLVSAGRLFWLRGIQPGLNPVSLFVDDRIVNDECFLATFRFDVMFIFTSILFLDPDKFVSIPQRIYELYRSGLDDSRGHSELEAAAFALWNQNVDDVQGRMEYLCECVHPGGTKDPLYKPDRASFRAMLECKVQRFERVAKERNLLMGAYCQSTQTSESGHVRKHHVDVSERKLRSFAWSVVSSMLCDEARSCLVPADAILKEKEPPSARDAAPGPVITSGKKPQKKPKASPVKGTPSITSFFKAS